MRHADHPVTRGVPRECTADGVLKGTGYQIGGQLGSVANATSSHGDEGYCKGRPADPPPYWVLPGPDAQTGRVTCAIFLVRGFATDTRNTRVCTCAAQEGHQRMHDAIQLSRRPRFAGTGGYLTL